MGKRLMERLERCRAENRRETIKNEEAVSRLSNVVMGMQGTLEVWDGKIRRVDSKMSHLQELGGKMEKSAET